VALLAFVVVAGGLGFSVWLAGGTGSRGSVASLTAGQTALEDARDAVEEVWSPGVDLVTGDPGRARELLEEAYGKLDEAEAGGIPARTVRPLRERVVAGLDELFGVVEIRPSVAFAFPATTPPTDMGALARGPDQRWYVIDRSAGTVIRIETQDQTAVPILRAGDVLGDVTIAKPKLLTTGGPDLLILDEANNLWRWRPADTSGRATLSRVRVVDSASWGDDIRAIGTFCRNADCSLYNLYVVDPSENQIMTYSPAADGSGYPGAATGRLATARDVSTFDDLYIDGDIFVVDDGTVERFVSGRDDGWHTEELDDEILRPGARFDRVHSGAAKRAGLIYAYDKENARLVGYDKIDGAYVEQYRLVGDDPALDDVRGMWVVPGIEEGPDTFVWVDRDRLMYSLLEQAQAASPAPSASAVPSGSVLPSGAPASGAPASPSPAAP
jgi:hypothetical protein